ncbi:Bifunctional NAD(P)H-hydrate repair enzyme Nnr [Paraconexibacter sp. AEG42_29]|uniref:Bifunctional NAD(P)H-hydrate repair enzyme n=1 Tax=Paraconexibacter sp. AEG42_29 TaxID=2997339 RepID=A0AAU7AY92_9ACTN
MTKLPDWLAPLPGSAAMRAADAAAIDAGTPGIALMERAGSGLAMLAGHLIPDGPIAVLCGKGNNGGDGFVAARLLHAAGRDVRVFTTSAREDSTGDAAENLARLALRPRPFDLESLDGCAGAIDALLGTGVTGEPRGAVARAIRVLHASGIPVIACDIPSGVDADTGAVPDPDTVVHARATVTFGAAKPGLWIAPGKAHAGNVNVIDIGVRAESGATVGLLTDDEVLEALPSRAAGSTKFTAGHVVVCGGSPGMTGAVCLAADAAMRAGVGYVTACVPHTLEPVFEIKLTEVMTRGVPEQDGRLEADAAGPVLEAVDARDGVLVLGGGLGRTDGALACARDVALRATGPLVLDADAIAAFAGDADALSARTGPTLLTPHAGELGRLLGVTSAEIEAARLEHVVDAARRTGAIVVLKGDDSLIATPDGLVAVSEGGAPALATAGTGDVLAGICGAFLAAGLEPFQAACAAVRAHLLAGRAAAAPHGPDGVIASDVIAALPGAISGARYAGRS